MVLEVALFGSYESLKNALYRGSRVQHTLPLSVKAVIRVWQMQVCKRREDSNRWSPATPLWFNPLVPEFQSIPDPALWTTKGIKAIEHICVDGVLIPFDTLKQINTSFDIYNSVMPSPHNLAPNL